MSISKEQLEMLRDMTQKVVSLSERERAALSAAIPVLEGARWRRLGEEVPETERIVLVSIGGSLPRVCRLRGDHWAEIDHNPIVASPDDLWRFLEGA